MYGLSNNSTLNEAEGHFCYFNTHTHTHNHFTTLWNL